eukprot:4856690-Prymnesium_polylepis.2
MPHRCTTHSLTHALRQTRPTPDLRTSLPSGPQCTPHPVSPRSTCLIRLHLCKLNQTSEASDLWCLPVCGCAAATVSSVFRDKLTLLDLQLMLKRMLLSIKGIPTHDQETPKQQRSTRGWCEVTTAVNAPLLTA